MYRYDSGKIPRIDDGYLYHFTTSQSLLKIVENMTLKLSSFTLLNDLNEDDLNCERSGGIDVIDIQNYIRDHCRLICFTQNYEQKGDFKCHCGCNHPRMWAQYAENNKGACIVINEKKFLERNKKDLEGKFYKIADVSYASSIFNKHIKTHSDKSGFIQKNWDHLFFKKYIDWEHEHERRLFGINLPEILSINGCIEFICLGRRFSDENLFNLIHLLVSPKYKSYLQLTPHDFAMQLNSSGSTETFGCASKILESLQISNSDTSKYLEWLFKKGYDLPFKSSNM